MVYAQTTYNRSRFIAVGGSGSVLARSFALFIPTPKLCHILPALVFAV